MLVLSGLAASSLAADASILETLPLTTDAPGTSAVSVVVSPNGDDIYVPNDTYRWNAVTRQLDFVGHGGWGGNEMLLSQDGRDLYGYSSGGSSVFRSSRDPITGLLTRREFTETGDQVQGFAFSINDEQLLVGTISSLLVFNRDAATGLLSLTQRFDDGVDGVTGLYIARTILNTNDGVHVYVWTTEARLLTFTRDPSTGSLTYESTTVGPAASVSDAVSTQAGDLVYVATPLLDGRSVQILSRTPSTGALTLLHTEPLDQPWQVLLSPSEDFLYVGDIETDDIIVYERDSATGLLSLVDRSPVGRFVDMAMSASGSELYSASSSVISFTRDSVTGELSLADVDAGSRELWHGLLSDDGRFFYAGDYKVITVFERDAITDELVYASGVRDEVLDSITGMTTTSDGNFLLVSGSRNVNVYARDALSGEIEFLETHTYPAPPGLLGARSPAMSPDETHLYVVGSSDDSVVTFGRDAATGRLTHEETVFDQTDANGMGVPLAVEVSPDGKHVYVAAQADDAIVLFDRDAVSGRVSFRRTYYNGADGIEFLTDPNLLHFTADGSRLYVVSSRDQAVSLFHRDPATGELTFVESQTSGHDGVPVAALNGAQDLGFSPDGDIAYVSGRSLSAFRVQADGRMTWIDSLRTEGVRLQVLPNGRVYTFLRDLPELHQLAFGCTAQPVSSCRQAQKSKLLIRDRSPNKKDALRWTWTKGEPVPLADFDPDPNNHFALCFYEEEGAVPELVHEALAPSGGQECTTAGQSTPKPCWATASQVKYSDPFSSPDGLRSIKLRPSVLPRSQIKVKGNGPSLGLPQLPLRTPLRVQLQTHAGNCWESLFDDPQKNESGLFKASAQ